MCGCEILKYSAAHGESMSVNLSESVQIMNLLPWMFRLRNVVERDIERLTSTHQPTHTLSWRWWRWLVVKMNERRGSRGWDRCLEQYLFLLLAVPTVTHHHPPPPPPLLSSASNPPPIIYETWHYLYVYYILLLLLYSLRDPDLCIFAILPPASVSHTSSHIPAHIHNIRNVRVCFCVREPHPLLWRWALLKSCVWNWILFAARVRL